MKELPFGLYGEYGTARFAFFKKTANLVNIKSVFSTHTFHRLHQTHSDISVVASEKTEVSDPTAGFSAIQGDSLIYENTSSTAALGVSTADCLPIILIGSTTLAAVHAGWRGIENEILLKTLSEHFNRDENIAAFIGPHIQWSSFEVDLPLAEKFLSQHLSYSSSLRESLDPKRVLKLSESNKTKGFINLAEIATQQLKLGRVASENIQISKIDTKTDLSWASFRREGRNMGKNLSFVSRRIN